MTLQAQQKKAAKEYLSKFGTFYNVYTGSGEAEALTAQLRETAKYRNTDIIDFLDSQIAEAFEAGRAEGLKECHITKDQYESGMY